MAKAQLQLAETEKNIYWLMFLQRLGRGGSACKHSWTSDLCLHLSISPSLPRPQCCSLCFSLHDDLRESSHFSTFIIPFCSGPWRKRIHLCQSFHFSISIDRPSILWVSWAGHCPSLSQSLWPKDWAISSTKFQYWGWEEASGLLKAYGWVEWALVPGGHS